MKMSLKLHVFPLSPRAFKVLLAAHHLGIDYELKFIDLFKGEQNAPEFRALNPHGRMPVLEEDGYVLWESNAIVNYLASKRPEANLLPTETRARLAVEKWQFWDSNHWDPACAVFVFERFVKSAIGRGAPDPAEIRRGEQLLARVAPALDGELGRHRYVAGDRLTVADLSVGSALAAAELAQYPLQQYRGIQRWHAELKDLPAWARTAELQREFASR
jgi:glutathione S-transferase